MINYLLILVLTLLALHNQVREQPLIMSEELMVNAETRAEQLAAQGYLSHSGFMLPYCCRSAGENIGLNRGYPDPAQTVFDGFMGSEGHRRNMLDPDFQYIGIGAARSGDIFFFALEYGGN